MILGIDSSLTKFAAEQKNELNQHKQIEADQQDVQNPLLVLLMILNNSMKLTKANLLWKLLSTDKMYMRSKKRNLYCSIAKDKRQVSENLEASSL